MFHVLLIIFDRFLLENGGHLHLYTPNPGPGLSWRPPVIVTSMSSSIEQAHLIIQSALLWFDHSQPHVLSQNQVSSVIIDTYIVSYLSWKPGFVSPLFVSISVVVYALQGSNAVPPNNMTPCGEAQLLWYSLVFCRVWVSCQEPSSGLKVTQYFCRPLWSPPPHVTNPVCVWSM